MELNHDNDRRLYHLFEDKLVEISQRVGYGGEETDSEAHRVFDEAWVMYLKGVGVERIPPVAKILQGWSPTVDFGKEELFDDGFSFIGDPLYTTGETLKIPDELAMKILTLGVLPENPAPTAGT